MHVLLATRHLRLRGVTPADADHLFALDNDPAVMRYLNGGTPTPRPTFDKDIFPNFLRYDRRYPGFGFWVAETKTANAFVGWFSLRPTTAAGDVAALGFRLRRACWGKGYATEGALALIDRAFTAWGLQRVVATTYEKNLGSRRVMEKAGMHLVRRFRLSAADLAQIDTFHSADAEVWDGDDVEYAIDRTPDQTAA